MKYSLEIADDTRDILDGLAKKMRLPTELTQEESLEVAIAALADSYDAQNDVETEEEGSPIDADALKKAIERTTDPDISTTFKQPEGEAQAERPVKYTFEEICKVAPTNTFVVEILKDEGGGDVVRLLKEAVMVTFSALPRSEWDTEQTKALVASSFELVTKRHLATSKSH